MARYRIAFSREWSVGRWGYLDRFFHDIGGQQSEPSGLANAWIVEYRGQARHLGRELAKALNIQATDYKKFGPIFDIEELPAEHRKPRRTAAPDAGAPYETPAESAPNADPAFPASSKLEEGETDPVAEAQGPSWVANSEVEDADLAESEPGFAHGNAQTAEAASSARAQARWDDLFRIRSRSGPTGRSRANVIAAARPPNPLPSSRRRRAPEVS